MNQLIDDILNKYDLTDLSNYDQPAACHNESIEIRDQTFYVRDWDKKYMDFLFCGEDCERYSHLYFVKEVCE